MFDQLSKRLSVKPEEAAVCLVIDLLLKDLCPEETIAVEVPFADHRRRADIVVSGEKLMGVEVKSAQDKVSQAVAQLADYAKCFEYSILATTPQQISAIYDELPRSIGLIEIKEGEACWRRRPMLVKRKHKRFVCSWLEKTSLARIAKNAGLQIEGFSRLSVFDIREIIADRLPTKRLLVEVKRELQTRFMPNFARFHRDYHWLCSPEDLMNLRRKDVGQSLRG